MLSIFVLWLTFFAPDPLVHPPIASLAVHRHFHVRVLDRRLDDLLDDAVRRSPTFASLVERLDATDVIVHVDRVMTLPSNLRARIALAGAGGAVRYLRIELRMNLGERDSMATLAHELHHALEIGEAREVRSDEDVYALYQRIGDMRGWMRFESLEADAVGRQVETELIEPRQP